MLKSCLYNTLANRRDERVHAVLPGARIVASHMDTVAHATLTRKTLREKLQKRGLADRVLIPEDGEKMTF
ncbi:MAG: hypothetical protein IKE69_02630 [Thermoguttaceae bacterium]|nr:hypothetical protein [Thermoguttaceae bacterium]